MEIKKTVTDITKEVLFICIKFYYFHEIILVQKRYIFSPLHDLLICNTYLLSLSIIVHIIAIIIIIIIVQRFFNRSPCIENSSHIIIDFFIELNFL